MTTDRDEKRRAYEAAKARQRAYYERYYPLRVLGGRSPEPVTPEVLIEIDRLTAASEAARLAYEVSKRAPGQPSADRGD
ncbi:MAG: hypothetical protein M0R75_07660 [Dehalococcoidia bacterium]|nr:hypothetical protein [Dehalococcoidia bacterium]